MSEKEIAKIPCTKCGKKISKKIKELSAHRSHEITCPACGAKFTLDTNKVQKAVREAEQSIADLKRNLGKTFK